MARSNPDKKVVRAAATKTAKPAAKVAKPKAAAPASKTKTASVNSSKTAASKAPVKAKAAAPVHKAVKPAAAGKTAAAVAPKSARSAAAPKKAMTPRAPRQDAAVVKVAARKPLTRKRSTVKKAEPQGRPELLNQPLPESYGMDRLVALPKDPEWTHLYWELKPETEAALREANGGELPAFHVRGFDTTDILFDGTNAPVSLDFEVAPYARSWYVRLPYQGRVYTFEYGHVTASGEWKGLLRSQPVGFNDRMADISSEEWVNIGSEELFRMAAGLGEGEGINDLLQRLRSASSAGQGGAAWLTSWGSGMGRLEISPSSFGLSSWQQAAGVGLSSWMTSPMGSGTSWGGSSPMGLPIRATRNGKDFWLWVETEIILYGATEPDAKVTLNGKELQLNADGTFRLQFPFPDGTEHDFHVVAVNHDGDQSREAEPMARRWTKR